jgi:hypothetical protein
MKRSLIALSVIGLLCAGVAGAAVHQGETEIGLSGSFTGINGETTSQDTMSWSVNALLGYFVSPNVEIAFVGNGDWTTIGKEDSAMGRERAWMYGFGPAVKYCFTPNSMWVPYVGAQAQWDWLNGGFWTNGAGSRDGLMYGPLAGLRFELNPKNDFFVEYQYRLYAGELKDVYNSAHAVVIGLAHQFR